ncbi:hypothetical protein [Malonomonas rubra]|uniref:hypothetical protein n=1 Tax=Malonomonas rubra TaxID=57040 RepID=UPI0026EE7F22|nr:hypothetical protein [Malonomonas rubra]
MDFQPLLDWVYTYYVQYPTFFYVVVGVLLLLILWKPAKVLKTTFLVLVLIFIVYICFYLIGSMNVGMNVKEKAIHRTEKAIEE